MRFEFFCMSPHCIKISKQRPAPALSFRTFPRPTSAPWSRIKQIIQDSLQVSSLCTCPTERKTSSLAWPMCRVCCGRKEMFHIKCEEIVYGTKKKNNVLLRTFLTLQKQVHSRARAERWSDDFLVVVVGVVVNFPSLVWVFVLQSVLLLTIRLLPSAVCPSAKKSGLYLVKCHAEGETRLCNQSLCSSFGITKLFLFYF